jgi:hypothetical protein
VSLAIPQIINEAWEAYADGRSIVSTEELSPHVSTNRVYRLVLSDRARVIAKLSSYGSYVHFRQDHQLVDQWISLLRGGRFDSLLARVLRQEERVFLHRGSIEVEGPDGKRTSDAWVVFYREAQTRAFLSRVQTDLEIVSLAKELAELHRECDQIRSELRPTWKSVGSDVANLYDALGNAAWRKEHNIASHLEGPLKGQCESFLDEAERLGYHRMHRIPILIDWNIGNFSVTPAKPGFRLFSRWDYDWFRIEPRVLDFYFCSRVVGQVGDRTEFSYLVDPLFEPRFQLFLRTYHKVFPLKEAELLFVKEAYRFFILNYVIRLGEHFFAPQIWPRLVQEAIDVYLPSLETRDFRNLLPALDY